MSCESTFLNQLRQLGFRLTPQREMVLLALHQIGHPAPAEVLFGMVAERSSSVEPSTIYRTLDLLVSMKLVNVIDTGEKQRYYELVGTELPHIHLACRVCGKISGIEIELFQPILDAIVKQNDFQADLSNLTILGLCGECKQIGLRAIAPA
ncbi:MAG: putative Fur-family transcriptional regulator [Chloroflexi bacterium]|nr:putative Fur-family transcriptional regulator [Chloroflexota bacterium]